MKYTISLCAFALIIMLFGLVDSTANASSQIFTQRLVTAGARWSETISFPQADPSRGKLVAVVLQLSGNVKSTAQVELPIAKKSADEQRISIDFDTAVQIYEPSISLEDLKSEDKLPSERLLVAIKPQAPIEEIIKPTLGRALFKKRPTATHFEAVGLDHQVIRLTEPEQLVDYIGNGLVSFPMQGNVATNVENGVQSDAYLRASTVTELSVEYIYQ